MDICFNPERVAPDHVNSRRTLVVQRNPFRVKEVLVSLPRVAASAATLGYVTQRLRRKDDEHLNEETRYNSVDGLAPGGVPYQAPSRLYQWSTAAPGAVG